MKVFYLIEMSITCDDSSIYLAPLSATKNLVAAILSANFL